MRCLLIFCMLFLLLQACKNSVRARPEDMKIDSTKLTTIQWLDSTDKNFGKIPEGQKLQVSFRFKNSGDKPLIIERVRASCGCTVAEQPGAPVAPGQEDVIKALFNSEGHSGINNKTLTVFANTAGSMSTDLHFAVEVEKKKW